MSSFKARIEQSSLGTKGGQAARRSVAPQVAANVVRAANAQRAGKNLRKS